MDKVQRLQRAAHHRAQSPSGLWQSTLPSQHRQAPSSSTSSESEKLGVSGDALEAALEAYTIAPPSEAALSIERTRTSLRFPWANRLSNLLQPLGHGPRPPTVLLQVYPPGPSEADIAHFIRQDGRQRDLPWKTSAPQSLRRLEGNEDVAAAAEDISYSNRSAAARDRKYDLEDEAAENEDADNGTEADLDDMADEPTGEKSIRLLPSGKARQRRALEQVDSRFVIVCDTDWEARRFHRGWNQRVMTTTTQGEVSRYMIRVSVIEW
jgi:hypothetical protein